MTPNSLHESPGVCPEHSLSLALAWPSCQVWKNVDLQSP